MIYGFRSNTEMVFTILSNRKYCYHYNLANTRNLCYNILN